MTADIELVAPTSVFHRTLDSSPPVVVRAEGSYLYTSDGRKILDGCGGAAVVSIGHGHPAIIEALHDQHVTYTHSGAWSSAPAEELAQLLVESSGMERALFYSGGSEAAESAIKLVRQYHLERGEPGRVNLIARDQSYHGNSLGALGLCRHVPRRKPYLPLLNSDNFHAVGPCYAYRYKTAGESDDAYVQRLAAELEDKIQSLGPSTVAAFFAETVVGATSGCTPAVPGYFKAVREVCDRHGVLLVLDEIMCGIGRTGKMHAWEWEGVQPDLQMCGKGLGGGYAPISAVLVSSKVVAGFRHGSGAFMNGYTYQAHALACRAGLEVLRTIMRDSLVEQCRQRGLLLERLLHEALDEHPHVGDIRGRGLFWGIEFVLDKASKTPYPASTPVADLVAQRCMDSSVAIYPGMKGTIDGVRGDHVLISPPYVVTKDEIGLIVTALAAAVTAVTQHIKTTE